MTTTHITVSGMTCGHCVNHVSSALKDIPGVTDVSVNLDNGDVSIDSEYEVNHSEISAAVTTAGYSLAE